MRFLFAFVSAVFSLVLVVPLLLVFLIPGNTPLVAEAKAPSHDDVRRIKTLIKQNNPLHIRQQQRRYIELEESDVNLLLRHGLNRIGGLAAHFELKQEHANMNATYRLPNNPFGKYLNIVGRWEERDNWIELSALKLGDVPMPGWLAQWAFARLEAELNARFTEYRELRAIINTVQLSDDKLVVAYDWHPDLIRRIQAGGSSFLVPDEQKKRLAFYHNQLAMFSHQVRWQPYSLDRLLSHMFAKANKRVEEGHDPAEENRAALLVMGVYASGVPLHRFLRAPDGRPLLFARFTRGSLNSRHDLMQHFLVSAALTVTAGTQLADVIGLAKELDDSMGGSGFSFADLLADRAGVRLGEMATRDAKSARGIQRFLMNGRLRESDFMPAVDRLPEGLTEAQFKQQYRNVESEAYRITENEIERRITACRLYREMENV